jgi:pimeloyl-ACP methyl ester carboxylesterase
LKQGHYTGNTGQPSKIVHIGHSYGSFLTHSLVADYPTLSDGAILTGIGYNATATSFPAFFEGGRLNIANTVSPERYPGLDSGYLASADVIGDAATFFHQGNYDKEILWYTQDISQPPSVMEFITGSPLSLAKPGALAFTSPVSFHE